MVNFIDPTRDKFSLMMKMPEEGKIHMLNMIRFRDYADYGDDRRVTGEQAYKTYGEESAPIFERVGGKIVHVWSPQLTLIGADHEAWDRVFIAEYPNAAAFGEMVKDPAYQIAVKHRQAAVADSRLVRLKPENASANFAF